MITSIGIDLSSSCVSGKSRECQPDEGVPLNECVSCDMMNAPEDHQCPLMQGAFFYGGNVNYQEARHFIEEHAWRGSVYGVDTMAHLADYLGHPEEDLHIIHIAGTNGKGSTVAHLAAILEAAGYITASYTSPEARTYLDRFQVQRAPVAEAAFAAALTRVAEAARQMADDGLPHPTVFEMELATSWLLAPVDDQAVFLMETGLGGRLDATNVVQNPILTVITAIGMDHTALLGDSLAAIAAEKAGIFKTGLPAVSWPQAPEAEAVLRRQAADKAVPLVFLASSEVEACGVIDGQEHFTYRGLPYATALPGVHQAVNAAGALVCVEALRKLGYRIDDKACRTGLADTRWPARMEKLPVEMPVYLDGAHNSPAMAVLVKTMQQIAPQGTWRLVLHIFKDKDAATMLKYLNGAAAELIITEIKTDRSLAADRLAALARQYAPDCRISLKPQLQDAITYIHKSAQANDYFVICGSLSHLEQARQLLLAESEAL